MGGSGREKAAWKYVNKPAGKRTAVKDGVSLRRFNNLRQKPHIRPLNMRVLRHFLIWYNRKAGNRQMKRGFFCRGEKHTKKNQRKKRWYRAAAGLACAAVLFTACGVVHLAAAIESERPRAGDSRVQAASVSQTGPAYGAEKLESHGNGGGHRKSLSAAENGASNDTTHSVTYGASEGGGLLFGITREGGVVVDGPIKITLLYGDQKDHPEGVLYYTNSTMSGYIKLEPNNQSSTLRDVTVTLMVPKKYVEKDSVSIPSFNTNSSVTEYEITGVTEDENNYCVSIEFSAYDQTQTLVVPFALSFLDNVVPDNYKLPVTAEINYNGETISKAEPIIYKPEYKKWGIDKFVNSNKQSAFKNDGTQVVVTAKDGDGNPYLSDSEYVEFYFMVNNVINSGSNLKDFRDADEVTLTDTLPTYQDKDGKTLTARFVPEANPGWTLNEDGKTVSKTYKGTNSSDVLLQIYNDGPLKLQFPGLEFITDPKDKNNLIANLENKVSLVATPSGMAEGETKPETEDSLKFVLTTDPSTKGRFTKVATKGNIYDAREYKTNPYPWKIRLSNDGIQPLKNIMIQDRKIEQSSGENGLAGLDPALKFVRLESNWRDSIPAKPETVANVEKVVAYYADGSKEDLPVAPDVSGDFTVEFDPNRICDGYEIIFKDEFEMGLNDAVSFMVYTVYRDPEHTVVPEGKEKITYENSARAVNIYQRDGLPVYSFLTVTHSYDMLPVTEELKVEKSTWFNNSNENNKVGDVYAYYIYLRGSLMTPDQKEYGDICVVDLLPNEVEYVSTTNGYEQYTDKDGNYGKPDIIENYHNSGRTALIYHITYETLTKYWEKTTYGTLSFKVKIREDVHPGSVRNDAYVVGDNLNEYSGSTGGTPDIYDLNNNGRTDDIIAHDASDAVIIAAESIYAEKFIALEGSENWNRQGLSLTAGSKFDYLLKVTNETNTPQTGLVVYDTLPAIGDKGIFGVSGRGSEFRVRLREPISAPEGYTVYYTTSDNVYEKSMSEMVSADIWVTSVEGDDYSNVTAFKLVANEGQELTSASPFEVRVPACIGALGSDSMDLLGEKEYQDRDSGTMAYLEAVNSFGYKTEENASPKESNTVWTRIPFAGFKIQKIDNQKGEGLAGAEFTLIQLGEEGVETSNRWTAVSGEDGFLEFGGLTEGTYKLTETGVPGGYIDHSISLTVTITQNEVTMEYKVTFGEPYTGAGTSDDPLVIENVFNSYELPESGGTDIALYLAGGAMMIGAVSLLAVPIKRRRP